MYKWGQLLVCRNRAYSVALKRKLFWKGGVAKANAHADRLQQAFIRRYQLDDSLVR